VAAKQPPLSEKQLVDRLRPRFEQDGGNGPAGCVVPQVRDAAGFDAQRTIDALGFHFWPSRGLLIDGFECKSSRSDWQRELAAPEKAESFCRVVDRFWIVAGRSDLVLEAELPPKWGLLVPRGDGLTQVRPAEILHPDETPTARNRRQARALPPGFNRSFLVAIIRQAYKVSRVTPEEIAQARRQGIEEGREQRTNASRNYHDLFQQLDTTVREFEQGLGYPIKGYSWPEHFEPKQVGAALRAILEGEHETTALRNRLNAIARDAQKLAEDAQRKVAALDAVEPAQARLLSTERVA
jgi:hypothetical protein